jgi:hypothetical protein
MVGCSFLIHLEKIRFCDKVYKFNVMDWKQERNMIITNKHIFNLKKKSIFAVLD